MNKNCHKIDRKATDQEDLNNLEGENSKEIQKRILTPINKCVNTYKQIRTRPINTDVKDIIKNNNINYNNWRYKSDRDYSKFDFSKLYANNFQKGLEKKPNES